MSTWKCIALTLSACVVAVAAADDSMAIVKKHAAEFDRAMMTKDIGWFEKVSTDNFMEFGLKGEKMTKGPALKQMKDAFKMMTVKRISTQVVSVREKGGAIVATLRTTMSGKMDIKGQPTKGNMTSDSTFQQRWIKEGGAWKIQWLKTIKERDTMDGKPMGAGM